MRKRMSNKTKKNLKLCAIIAASILAVVLIVSWIGSVTKGFENMNPKDWEIVQRNEENLLPVEALLDEFDNGNGYAIEKSDAGVLKISGRNESETQEQVQLGTVTLKPGTYIFTTGKDGKNSDASNFNFNMSLKSGANTYYADFGGAFRVEAETTFTVVLTLGAEKSFNGRTLYPAIYAGEDAQEFYQ